MILRSCAPFLLTAITALSAPLVSGCGGPTTEENAQHIAGAAQIADAQAGLIAAVYEGGIHEPTPEAFAQTSASVLKAKFGGCAAATVDGAEVTYAFDGCDGPFGLFGLSGEVQVVYDILPWHDEPGEFPSVELKSSSVKANGFDFGFTASARSVNLRSYWCNMPEYCEPAFVNAIDVTTDAVLVEEGESLHDTNDFVTFFGDDRCGDPDTTPPAIEESFGFAEYKPGYGLEADLTAYRRCGGGCPDDGGRVGGIKLLVSFDGTETAHFTDDGDTGTVPLRCGAQ